MFDAPAFPRAREIPDVEPAPTLSVQQANPAAVLTVGRLIELLSFLPENAPVTLRDIAFDSVIHADRVTTLYVDVTPGESPSLVFDAGDLLSESRAVLSLEEYAEKAAPRRGNQGADPANPRRGTGGPAGDDADGGHDPLNPPTQDDPEFVGPGSDTDNGELDDDGDGDGDADSDE